MTTTFVPKVENKYNLTYQDLANLKVGNREAIPKYFSYNEYVSAWINHDGTSDRFCECEYFIHIYDNDAPEHAGEVKVKFICYMGACGFHFNSFYVPEEVKNDEERLEIQEKFMATINTLLDEGILVKE